MNKKIEQYAELSDRIFIVKRLSILNFDSFLQFQYSLEI